MAARDWDAHYAGEQMPWDTGVPDPHLVEVASALRPGRALEIGCGTGTNAVWLATNGWSVVALDLAPRAIARARQRAEDAGVTLDLHVADVLADPVPGGPFDLVFDRGCFHVFDEAAERAGFAEHVASVLAPGGRWLSLCGNTEGPPRDAGPPRRSARDLADAIEPHLAIVDLRQVEFDPASGEHKLAWRAVYAKRDVPAQASTRRG